MCTQLTNIFSYSLNSSWSLLCVPEACCTTWSYTVCIQAIGARVSTTLCCIWFWPRCAPITLVFTCTRIERAKKESNMCHMNSMHRLIRRWKTREELYRMWTPVCRHIFGNDMGTYALVSLFYVFGVCSQHIIKGQDFTYFISIFFLREYCCCFHYVAVDFSVKDKWQLYCITSPFKHQEFVFLSVRHVSYWGIILNVTYYYLLTNGIWNESRTFEEI